MPNATEPPALGELALAGVIGRPQAQAIVERFSRSDDGAARYALPWWSARGDTVLLRQFLRRRGARATRADDLDARNDVAIGNAYLLLARRDTLGALRSFELLPDSLCPICAFGRLTRAELLLGSGRLADARRLLSDELSWITVAPKLGDTRWELLRGIAAERMGDQGVAQRSYRRVAATLRGADAELVPWRDKAQAGLRRLASGPPR
jgi:hypothetical protein